MREVRTIKVDTTNGWGFGGWVGDQIIYDNGLIHNKGRSYFRHLPSETHDRWYVMPLADSDFSIQIDGNFKNAKEVNIYRGKQGTEYENSYRAGFDSAKPKHTPEFEKWFEHFRTITLPKL